jgi:hypothetical protein
MATVQFVQRCLPMNSLRIEDTYNLLQMTSAAFGETAWLDESNTKITDLRSVRDSMRRNILNADETQGITWAVKSAERPNAMLLKVAVGGGPYRPNFFTLNSSSEDLFPQVNFVVDAIALIRPAEAFVTTIENDRHLRDSLRLGGQVHARTFLLRWLHYFSYPLANALGGRERIGRAPVYRCLELEHGILLQVEEMLKDLTGEDASLYQEVMNYLGREEAGVALSKFYSGELS